MLDEREVGKRMIHAYGIRIGPEMAKYVIKNMSKGASPLPVMGGNARTGIPVALAIDPGRLTDEQGTQGGESSL